MNVKNYSAYDVEYSNNIIIMQLNSPKIRKTLLNIIRYTEPTDNNLFVILQAAFTFFFLIKK